MWSRITSEPLQPELLLGRVGGAADGAVRNHAEGQAVSGMTYEAYAEMASDELAQIVAEAAETLGTEQIAVEHRIGALTIGEASVVIAVASPHRDEAYRASRQIIEKIKVRLPVWKREHRVDGADAWVPGADPVPAERHNPHVRPGS
jgi:molybdopterin synthase catalytic subunit